MQGFCPGSKSAKSPTPELIACPECGYEVEVWTHELMRHCPQCKTAVFREKRPSCLDWCSYAKECVGPELYATLKAPTQAGVAGPLETLRREHEEAQKRLALLKGASLCLRAAAKGGSQAGETYQQGLLTLGRVLHFLDTELRDHFRREEEGLFPMLQGHMGKDGSPLSVLLSEHQELWRQVDRLRQKAGEVTGSDGARAADEVEETAGAIARLLQGHIDKENTMLLPLAQASLGESGLARLSARWAELQKPTP